MNNMNNMNVNIFFNKKLNTHSVIRKILSSKADISFGGGSGDHLPPEELLHAFKDVLSTPKKFYSSTRYSDIMGDSRFRSAIAEFENEIYERNTLKKENVIIGQGSTELTSSLFKILLEKKDNVLLFDPSYANFQNQIENENDAVNLIRLPLVSRDITHILRTDKKKFLRQFKTVFANNKIKLCVICNPDNPTSIIWDDDILFEMIQIASDNNTWFVMDLSYAAFYFSDNMPNSFKLSPLNYPHLITIHSFSKIFSLLGFRLGYLVAQPEIIRLMECIEMTRNLSPNALVQNILSSFFKTTQTENIKKYCADQRQLYKSVSKFTLRLIREKLPKAKVLEPDGGFYFVISFEDYNICNAIEFGEEILEKEGISILPGGDFGESLKHAFRFSFAPLIRDIDKIEKGINALANFINNKERIR